ncbi:hypothetical protein [Streptomyces sp. NRRL F-2580]|uniref:hypothetical protein n=1 Tax=Streptomyces sp. NRRL F-2580 TaxID=1463841 RepID=UPI00131DB016|nr:hypothetical protein [Streptomyces sp. NRRL F-2580]
MKWQALRAAAVLGMSGLLITGCSDSEGAKPSDHPPAATAASAAAPSSAPSAEPVSARAQAAEKVKLAVEKRISADERQFGSGVNSPCSTSSPQMLTAKCKAAADATSDAAGLALTEIDGRQGFATLDSAARKLQTAVRTYETLGCATEPTAADTRTACLEPAAVIAQGFADLRGGANAGLAGK